MKHKNLVVALFALAFFIIGASCFGASTARPPLKFAPDELPEAQLGQPYLAEIRVTQNVTPVGKFSVSQGALPKGLALEKVDGEQDLARITGTPEETGVFTFTISAWCYSTSVKGQTGEKEYTLVVR